MRYKKGISLFGCIRYKVKNIGVQYRDILNKIISAGVLVERNLIPTKKLLENIIVLMNKQDLVIVIEIENEETYKEEVKCLYRNLFVNMKGVLKLEVYIIYQDVLSNKADVILENGGYYDKAYNIELIKSFDKEDYVRYKMVELLEDARYDRVA